MFTYKLFHKAPDLHVANDTGGDKPVIIFLHGIASTSATWNPLTPLLKKNYRCITIDLLGFGKSPRPKDCEYLPEDHLKAIHKAIKKLKVRHFIIAGHSLGSLLAAEYTAWHPYKVKRLVMISPPVYLDSKDSGGSLANATTASYLKAYNLLRDSQRFTVVASKAINKLLPKGIMDINKQNWVAFYKTLKNNIENQSVLKDLNNTYRQVDIFYGALDQFIVEDNIKQLGKLSNVTVHRVLLADHVIRGRTSKKIAEVLNQ